MPRFFIGIMLSLVDLFGSLRIPHVNFYFDAINATLQHSVKIKELCVALVAETGIFQLKTAKIQAKTKGNGIKASSKVMPFEPKKMGKV